MAGITLAQAEAQLASWIAASTAVASGQSYSMGERSLTLTNAAEIRKSIEFWDAKVSELTASAGGSGRKIRGITPC